MRMIEIDLCEGTAVMDVNDAYYEIKQLSKRLVNEKFKTIDVSTTSIEDLIKITDDLAANI